VDKVFKEQPVFLQNIKNQEVSQSISGLRELVWNEYLKDEVKFNVILRNKGDVGQGFKFKKKGDLKKGSVPFCLIPLKLK
jgi:hypothetical protein